MLASGGRIGHMEERTDISPKTKLKTGEGAEVGEAMEERADISPKSEPAPEPKTELASEPKPAPEPTPKAKAKLATDPAPKAKAKPKPKLNFKKLIAAVLGFVVGAVVYLACGNVGLTSQGVTCLAILAWAIVWWIGGVLPEYATGLLMVVGFAVLGGVDSSVSFAAFSTSTWWLLIAAFALGAGMKTSGLMKRMALAIIRIFPNTFQAQVGGLMAVGTILGPLVPSLATKTAMLTPIAMSMGDAMGYKRKGREMQGLFLAMLAGVRNIGPAVISASVIGYALWGLLPDDVRTQFDMLHWFFAALPWFIVVTVLNYVAIVALYRPRKGRDGAATGAPSTAAADATGVVDATPATSSADAAPSADSTGTPATPATSSTAAVDTAGVKPSTPATSTTPSTNPKPTPMSTHERIMLVIILVTVALWVTEPLHNIPSHIVALVALVAMVAFGIMTKASFKSDISWDSLIFIGTAIGLSSVFSAVGIQDWIVEMAGPVFQSLAANPYAFVLGIGVITILMRFVIVSEMAYVNIVMVFLIPLAVAQGVNPWVVGIAVYAVVNPWFVLYQNPVYLAAYYSVDGEMVRHVDMAKYCVLYMLICLFGLAVSVPYWQFLGLF